MTIPARPADPCAGWSDPIMVAAILAVSGAGLGVRLRMPAGGECQSWLALLRAGLAPDRPVRRCPPSADHDRLLGGLDLAATLAARRRVMCTGLLAECDTGVLVLPVTARASPSLLTCVGAALESGELELDRNGRDARVPARFALVVLDDAADEDAPPPSGLLDRLAFTVRAGDQIRARGADPLRPIDPFHPPSGYDVVLQAARERIDGVVAPDAVSDALCRAALSAGIASLRAPVLALRVARIVAALQGRDRVEEADACVAARLVLAPRAMALPEARSLGGEAPDGAPPPPPGGSETTNAPTPPQQDAGRSDAPPPPSGSAGDADPAAGSDQKGSDQTGSDQTGSDLAGIDLAGIVLDAVRAAAPAGLLGQLRATTPTPGGRAPVRSAGGRTEGGRQARQASATRGRPIGSLAGDPARGRIDVLATLRAALPWQELRAATEPAPDPSATLASPPPRIRVRRSDFRITRFLPRSRSVTIFMLDASGSAARARLAEAKGCVSILLAECYARRDQVALVECRNAGASVLLPPTGAVVRARRALDGLAGGGGTPLASGLDVALLLAARVRRDGGLPRLLLLTDGRANVARDGAADRARALQEALDSARALRAAAIPSLLVDISSRPRNGATPEASLLADALGGRCVTLPRNDPQALAREAAARP